IEQRAVGKLDAAAQRVAEELAAKLLHEIVAASGEEILAQTVQPAEFGAVDELDLCIHGKAGGVGAAETANGVVAFEREAEGIEARVTAGAAFVTGVALDELALGEALRGFLWKYGHALGRAREAVAGEHFAEPVAAQDGARAGSTALF